MKPIRLLLLLGACCAANAYAQSFGNFLRGAAAEATRAVATATGDKVAAAITGQSAAAAPQPSETVLSALGTALAGMAPGAAPASAAAPTRCGRVRDHALVAGPRPDDFEPVLLWPENAACPVGDFGEFSFERAKAAKNAFRQASRVPCNDCEGGYGFDAWGGRDLVKHGDYSVEFPKLLAGLKIGESVGWKGSKYRVTITATGDRPIAGVACRQLHYALLAQDVAAQLAEYDGMVCEYKGAYASGASWQQVI